MSEEKLIKCLEEYIQAEDKNRYLSKLLPGTEEHTYMTLTSELCQLGEGQPPSRSLSKKIERALPKNARKYQGGIKFRYLLKKLEAAKNDPKAAKKLAREINNDFFGFHFKYKRPQNADGMIVGHEEDKKYESVLKEDFFASFSKKLTETQKKELSYFSDVYSPALYLLDFEVDLKKYFEKNDSNSAFKSKLLQIPYFFKSGLVKELLFKYMQKVDVYDTKKLIEAIPLKVYNEFLQNLEDLKFDETFIDLLYYKNFKKKLNQMKTLDEIKRVYLWAMTPRIKKQYPIIKRKVNLCILKFLAKRRQTDIELFEDYIKDPVRFEQYHSPLLKKNDKYRDFYGCDYVDFEGVNNQTAILTDHFKMLYKEGHDILKFKKFFKKDFLVTMKTMFSLLEGKQPKEAVKLFNKYQLDNLNQAKEIKFISKDIDSQPVEQAVRVEVSLKNIKNLIVQVFEINTINYVKDEKKNVPANIRIDGLISIMEKTYTYDEAAIKEHEEVFEFEELKGVKKGVYVINFIGDGISARVVLRRGVLQLVKEVIRGGYVCYIVDEDGEVCKGTYPVGKSTDFSKIQEKEKTGFYDSEEGKFYPADTTGMINFPFTSGTRNLVLVHEGFGYTASESFEAERVEIEANWIFDEETFLPGNEANLLLNLRMKVNGKVVPRANINSCAVEIDFTKENGDRTSVKFEDLKIKEDEDNLVAFYVPNKIKTISLITKTKYIHVTSKEEKEDTNSTTIQLITRDGATQTSHIFLQKTDQDGVVLNVRGKNGEPIQKVGLEVTFNLDWKTDYEYRSLITDEDGKVVLGDLEGVVSLSTRSLVSEIKLDALFHLRDRNSRKYEHQRVFLLEEGEVFKTTHIPSFFKEGPDYTLFEVRSFSVADVIKDLTGSVVIAEDSNTIKIEGLRPGQYLLSNLKVGNEYRITVVKTKKLTERLRVDDKNYYHFRSQKTIISNIDSYTQDGNTVKIKLDDFDEKTRVHVVNSTFIPEGFNYDLVCDKIGDIHGQSFTVIKKETAKSSLVEDCKLSGEMLYALNRKGQNEAIGITSEKPKLFLKGEVNRETSYARERVADFGNNDFNDLNDDSEFEEDEDEFEFEEERPKFKKRAKKKVKKDRGKKGGYYPKLSSGNLSHNFKRLSNSAKASQTLNFEKMRSFLKEPSTLISNLKPNEAGEVEIDIKDLKGSYIKFYAINANFITQKSFVLPKRDRVEFRDLRLDKSRDINKTFSYLRQIYTLIAPQKQSIADYTKAEIEVVDSIPKMVDIIKKFSRQGTASKVSDSWDSLKSWGVLDFEVMTKYIDDNFSNELNFFIFNEDRELFDSVIKPFLKCKLKMEFMDYYLLEKTEKLAEYLQPQLLKTLSAIEKVLLIQVLGKSHRDDCLKILEIMKGEDFLNDYSDTAGYDYIFDKLINMSSAARVEFLVKKKNFNFKRATEDYDQISAISDNSYLAFDDIQQNIDFNFPEEANDPFFEERQMQMQKPVQQRIIMPEMLTNVSYKYSANYEENQMRAPSRYQERQNMRRSREMGRRGLPMRNIAQVGARRRAFDDDEEIEGEDDSDDDEEIEGEDDSESFSGSGMDEDYDGGSGMSEQYEYNTNFDIVNRKNRKIEVKRLNLSSLKKTQEFIERGYLTDARHAQINKFWVELAEYILNTDPEKKPFLSQNFVYCPECQIPFIIPFMALDSEAEKHEFKTEGSEYFIEVKSNTILYFKHLKETEGSEEDTSNNVLAAQKWFDSRERYIYDAEKNRNVEKEVAYFLKGKVYGSQLVISNVSSTNQDLEIITEIPQGAIPVSKNDFHLVYTESVAQFSTKKYQFFFYFPEEGEYSFCPACVTCDGKRINIQASSTKITVLSQRPIGGNLENISDILDRGSQEDILNFMRNNNISNKKVFNFENIYWLLKDSNFYKECIKILKEKRIYDQKIWTFSFYHGDLQTITEALQDYFQELEMKFLKFNAQNFENFTIKEYNPIINSRFHKLTRDKTVILNKEFKSTYLQFLKYFFEKEGHNTADDYIVFAYYLLLQDRTDEAIEVIKNIKNPDSVNFEVQLDYMRAYFDMYTGLPEFKVARELCEKNIAYPIDSWKNLFVEIANQIADFDGELNNQAQRKPDEDLEKDEKTEMMNVKLDGGKLNIMYQNIENLTLDYFLIDLELLFSISPFLGKEFEKLVYVQPHTTKKQRLEKSRTMKSFEAQIPENLKKKDLVIKVTGDKHKSILVYSYSTFKVNVNINTGMVKVCDEALKPLARTYVKCFAKYSNQSVEFFKDGYTDIRGSFNFCDMKKSNLTNITKFALYVNNKEHGSVIKEITKPVVLKKDVFKVDLASKNWIRKQKMASQAYGHLQSRAKHKKRKMNLKY